MLANATRPRVKGIKTMLRWMASLMLLISLHAFAQGIGTVTYVYTDPQGTPLAETDANGNITATFEYTPYGTYAPTGTSNPGQDPNGPGYTGHVNDPETNLVYMQARYYDPATGRFLSTDPIAPSAGEAFGFNRYDYGDNNPIGHTDPTGKFPGNLNDPACNAAYNCQIRFVSYDPISTPQGQQESSATAQQNSQQGAPGGKAQAATTAKIASALSYNEMKTLVSKNNKSGQDDSLIIAVAWKESGFDPNAKAKTSTASGLLQMTRGATKQVGGDFSKIMNPAYNISVGSQYIGLRIRWAQGDVAKGLDGFGTGAGYSTNIISAASALKANPQNGVQILKSIHP